MKIRHRIKTRTAAAACVILALASCGEQPSGKAGPSVKASDVTNFKNTELYRTDLMDVPGKEVIVRLVEIPAGMTMPKHTHPGDEFVYAVEGSSFLLIAGQPEKTFKQGEVVHVPPRVVHTGGTKTAAGRFVVFQIHDKGKPERTIVE